MTIALRCRIRSGPFSGWKECAFTNPLAREDIVTLASVSRCHTPDWQPIAPCDPADGQEIVGLMEVHLRPDEIHDRPELFLVSVQHDLTMRLHWVHRDQLVQSPQPSLDELRRKAGP